MAELKDCLPFLGLPGFQEPDSNPKILPWGRGRDGRGGRGGGGASASLSVGEASPAPLGSVSYATPHPWLF